MRLLWWLTGGRPMRFVGTAFVDAVSRRPVGMYKDRLGRLWLAEGGWSLFRVRVHERSGGYDGSAV